MEIFLKNSKNKNIAQKQVYCFQKKIIPMFQTLFRLFSIFFFATMSDQYSGSKV